MLPVLRFKAYTAPPNPHLLSFINFDFISPSLLPPSKSTQTSATFTRIHFRLCEITEVFDEVLNRHLTILRRLLSRSSPPQFHSRRIRSWWELFRQSPLSRSCIATVRPTSPPHSFFILFFRRRNFFAIMFPLIDVTIAPRQTPELYLCGATTVFRHDQ